MLPPELTVEPSSSMCLVFFLVNFLHFSFQRLVADLEITFPEDKLVDLVPDLGGHSKERRGFGVTEHSTCGSAQGHQACTWRVIHCLLYIGYIIFVYVGQADASSLSI